MVTIFDPKPVSIEIMNVLSKYRTPIDAVDELFAGIKGDIMSQPVQPAETIDGLSPRALLNCRKTLLSDIEAQLRQREKFPESYEYV